MLLRADYEWRTAGDGRPFATRISSPNRDPPPVHPHLAVSLYSSNMAELDGLLCAFGGGPSTQGELNRARLDRLQHHMSTVELYEYAMNVHLKRVVGQLVEPKWREKILVQNYFYRLIMTGRVPRTEKARKGVMVAMLDEYHSMEFAMRNTCTHWGEYLDRGDALIVYNSMGLDFSLYTRRPMSSVEFCTQFSAAASVQAIAQFYSMHPSFKEWFTAVCHRYRPLARHRMEFAPAEFVVFVTAVLTGHIPHPGDRITPVRFGQWFDQVLHTFCTEVYRRDLHECIATLMYRHDPELFTEINEFRFVGSLASIGRAFHLRSLGRKFGRTMEEVDSIRMEMEGMDGSGTADAFQQVVQKYFPPYNGQLFCIGYIASLAVNTDETVFLDKN